MVLQSSLTWLIGLPLVASPLVYLLGRVAVLRNVLRDTARWLALLAALLAAIPLYGAARTLLTTGVPLEMSVGAVALRLDGVSLVLAGSVWLLGTLVVLFSGPYMAGETGEEKYYALLIAMMGTMIGLGCTFDLFNLWVWFEAMAVTSYMLVAFYRRQPASLEAGVKYLVQSATGSVLVLLGIALVFGVTGSLNLEVIRTSASAGSPLLLAAGALFLIGFGVKAALVPLHTWLPDAHSQAPSGISAMLSGVVIAAGLVALLRAVGAISGVSVSWGGLLLGFAALNMLVGNLMALRQTQVKRLLAYSSLSHMGYMLLGFGVAAAFGQVDGAAGGFFHLITHAMMKGLAFLAAGILLYCLHLAKDQHQPLMVSDLAGAAKRYPLAALALSIAVLGLGGLPPLAGFMSKWQIFVGGFATHNTAVMLLVIFAGINSVLSLGYYAPLVNRMYRRQPSHEVMNGAPSDWRMDVPLVILSALILVLGFIPSLISGLTDAAAVSLLTAFGW